MNTREKFFRFRNLDIPLIVLLLALFTPFKNAYAQTTPIPVVGAFGAADCPAGFGDDDQFRNFLEYEENLVGAVYESFGEASIENGTNEIGLIYEAYSSTENNATASGISSTNGQDLTIDDEYIFIFDQDLDNPVIRFSGMDPDNHVCFFDLEGNPLTAIPTEGGPSQDGSGCWFDNGSAWAVQITETVDAVHVVVDIEDADAYQVQLYSCMLNFPPEPIPACNACGAGTVYDFINLTNYDDITMMGDIELAGVNYGSFEVVNSDLDIRNDTKGKMFGGFDRDGGTQLFKLNFCQPLAIQEIDIRNLEVESEVSIGTMSTTMDATAVLSGLTLTQCAGSSRMGVDPNPDNGELNFVKTDGPGCGANPNGTYTVDATVEELYFKYHNPPGGCTGDYVGFRIGTCVPDPAVTQAVPECPLFLVDVSGTNYVRDSIGRYFDTNSCTDAAFMDAVSNMTPFDLVALPFCPDMVVEECNLCNEATECPAGQSIYTVYHVDENEGYLPGGICVETSITGSTSGVLQLSNAGALSSVFVNTMNNITDGGALSYTKTQDGDDFNVTYDFCSDIVDPYIYIGKTGPEKNTVISFFESDGVTAIPITYLDGQSDFVVNAPNEITATRNNRVGYVQIQDGVPRSSIVVNVVNGPRYAADAFRLGVGVCAPDIMQAQPQCPIGLFSWQKDGVEEYKVYVDATGASYYAKDELCTETSLGDLVFDTSGPICGTLVPISPNCLTTGCENIVASGSPYTPTTPITIENDCPEESVLLSDFVSPAFVPAGGVVSYHSATPVSSGNEITNLEISASGSYYVGYTVPGQALTELMQLDVLITACDPCDAAVESDMTICEQINGDPMHPLADLDCDEGGVSNIIECNNGLDPDDPSDDMIPCNAGQTPPVLIGN